MQVQCYRCNMSYALGKDEIAFALAALREEDAGHYDSQCPRCRTKNRVSFEQLEKAAAARGIEPLVLDAGEAESDDPAK